ncbi:hypothetical protein HDU76_009970 [Blyttiomyces sp. JEL0837]|nr:hypothetical protein HDU76_009970 [Blyttiomyces sp. JEL0837]
MTNNKLPGLNPNDKQDIITINIPLGESPHPPTMTLTFNETLSMISVTFICILPYYNTTDPRSPIPLNSTTPTLIPQAKLFNHIQQMCLAAKSSIIRASTRLQSVILFTQPIKMQSTFESFCLRELGYPDISLFDNLDKVPICEWNGVLGNAAPASWHSFDADVARQLKLDEDYLYPSALAKQYLGAGSSDAADLGDVDIESSFNADSPWWFGSPDNIMGEGAGYGGSGDPYLKQSYPLTNKNKFRNPTKLKPPPSASKNSQFSRRERKHPNSNSHFSSRPSEKPSPKSIKNKVFDYEQIFIHESFHGLGFISSWYEWMGSETVLPGFPIPALLSDDGATILKPPGISKSYIYDKFIADDKNGVWMRDYANAIRKVAKDVGVKLLMDAVSTNLLKNDTQSTGKFRQHKNNVTTTTTYQLPQQPQPPRNHPNPSNANANSNTGEIDIDNGGIPISSIPSNLLPSLLTSDQDSPWDITFRQSHAWNLSTYLHNNLVISTNAIAIWYPSPTISTGGFNSKLNQYNVTTNRYRYAILHTPRQYEGGSTLSHVDAAFYAGTSEFLMRPFAVAGVGLDAYVPAGPRGPMGEIALGVLRAMGYVTNLGPLGPLG